MRLIDPVVELQGLRIDGRAHLSAPFIERLELLLMIREFTPRALLEPTVFSLGFVKTSFGSLDEFLALPDHVVLFEDAFLDHTQLFPLPTNFCVHQAVFLIRLGAHQIAVRFEERFLSLRKIQLKALEMNPEQLQLPLARLDAGLRFSRVTTSAGQDTGHSIHETLRFRPLAVDLTEGHELQRELTGVAGILIGCHESSVNPVGGGNTQL